MRQTCLIKGENKSNHRIDNEVPHSIIYHQQKLNILNHVDMLLQIMLG